MQNNKVANKFEKRPTVCLNESNQNPCNYNTIHPSLDGKVKNYVCSKESAEGIVANISTIFIIHSLIKLKLS